MVCCLIKDHLPPPDHQGASIRGRSPATYRLVSSAMYTIYSDKILDPEQLPFTTVTMLVARAPPTSAPPLFPAQQSSSPQSHSSTSSHPISQSYSTNTTTPATTDLPPASATTHSPVIRQWTLQPRPKPGRKPAVDPPPTKRKAQNREAQRAFRERRAQRVGELEEHIKQEQSTFQHKYAQWEQMERTLVGNINGWRERAEFWEARARGMERQLSQLQEMNGQLREEVGRLQNMWTTQSHAHTLPSISSLTDLAPMPTVTTEVLESCKSCGDGGKCACMEAVLESCKNCGDGGKCACMDAVMGGLSTEIKEEDDQPMEIDFTTNRMGTTTTEPIIVDSAIMEDGCGFCSAPGGTSCPCKEAISEVSVLNAQPDNSISSPALPLPTRTTVTSTQSTKTNPSGAAKSGPGSCMACQSDPERRRFCQTLAGLMPPPARPDAPINSVNNKSQPDITKTQNTSKIHNTSEPTIASTPAVDVDARLPTIQLSANPDARISCADAYTYFKQLPPGTRDRHEFVQQLRAQPAQPSQNLSSPSSNVFAIAITSETSSYTSSAQSTSTTSKKQGKDSKSKLKCTTCNDVGCAPLEVDAASVLTAMRMGLAADTRFTANNVMRRESSMYVDEGSE